MPESIGLQSLDYGIIAIYLVATLIVGIWLERKASASSEAFFLGNRKLPWWALGASGMASNVDISGTALAVGLVYALGVSGFFIEIRGGIVLIMALFLAFAGKWNRRSGVMTSAEWMTFRFGDTKGGRAARLISASAEVLGTIPIIAYFAIGLETFVGPLMPPAWANNAEATRLVCLGLIAFIVLYTTSSGLFGVVWTDVLQGGVILVGVLYMCSVGFMQPALPESFQTSVPLEADASGQMTFQTVEHTSAEWLNAMPPASRDTPGVYSQYNNYAFMISMFILLTVMQGSSGGGGYMAQRYLAARNEREAGLISLIWIVLLSLRWPLVVAMAVIGIHHGIRTGTPIANPESVLPTVIGQYAPTGLRGMLVACFLAAFMSTFSAFVNATSAYWTNDIYRGFLKPSATPKQLVMQGRIASVIIVALGLWFSYQLKGINEIWGWLTGALGAGLAIPMLLRWYWWRFNGWGFAIGTAAGMVGALAVWKIAPMVVGRGLADHEFLLVNGLWTLTISVAATLLTSVPPMETIRKFYRQTRPFGFWGPLMKELPPEDQTRYRREHRNDIVSAFLAVPAQLTLFLLPMMIVVRQWGQVAVLASIVAMLGAGLYLFWYRNLSKEE